MHDGNVGCNTTEYIMALLCSDWLCFPCADIDQLPDPTVLYNLLDAASNSTPCLSDTMALVNKDKGPSSVCGDSVYTLSGISTCPQSPAISEAGCSTDEGIQSDISDDLECIDG